MERLYTPWRREFIENSASSGTGASQACFLCEVPARDDDARGFVLHRGQQVFTLLNMYPYNSGHLMVAPFAHTGDFAGLQPALAEELMRETQRCVDVLQQVYRPDAFNVGMNLGRAAGAGVPDHLHVHVVPRWVGDSNFMPIVGETKVLPESLDQTYERLRPRFES